MADQQFRRRHAGQLVQNQVTGGGVVPEFTHQKFAGGQIEKAESIGHDPGLFLATDGGHVEIALVVEELGVGDHPGRDHPYHLPLDNPFGQGRIFDLLADGHPPARLDQLGQIGRGRMVGETAQWHLVGLILVVAAGEGDAEDLGGDDGILKEHLVKITHPVEENGVRVALFDLKVLLEHGGDFHSLGHGRYTWLRQLREFVDGGLQSLLPVVGVFVDMQNGVGAGSPMRAAALKGSRVDEQDAPGLMADSLMGVAIDDTVGLGKNGPDSFFNGIPWAPGAMAQPDPVAADGDQPADRQELPALPAAHVAMDRMDLFVAKSLKDGDIGEVTGVEDDGTFRKDRFDLSAKGICTVVQMGI